MRGCPYLFNEPYKIRYLSNSPINHQEKSILKMCDIWKFMIFYMTCLVLFIGLLVTNDKFDRQWKHLIQDLELGNLITELNKGDALRVGADNDRPKKLTYDNYDQIIRNSTLEFKLKHLIQDQGSKSRKNSALFSCTINSALFLHYFTIHSQ